MADKTTSAYGELMFVIRNRFDIIETTKTSMVEAFTRAETCAFHGRKIVEGISFGCLIALENGVNHIPRDAKGQWKADAILHALEKKNFGSSFPSPSIIRAATVEETATENAKIVIEGQPDKRISKDELISLYQRLHRWNHEINPYVVESRSSFLDKYEEELWDDIEKLRGLVDKHFISIGGKGFFCVLKDNTDGQVKVFPLNKLAE